MPAKMKSSSKSNVSKPNTKSKKWKIKNWKLAILAFILFATFIGLGVWQLQRAAQKQTLLNHYAERALHAPFTGKDLNNINDWRFYRVQLTGKFDNEHTFLLDNKVFKGQIGYEVYTPFHAQGIKSPILIDRGFVSMGESRQQLPKINDIRGNVTINGMLNFPPLYVALGKMADVPNVTWPLRVEFINLPLFDKLIGDQLFPYIVNIDPKDARAYPIEWQVVSSSPERHTGYAVQWFALALTLLILFVALNRA